METVELRGIRTRVCNDCLYEDMTSSQLMNHLEDDPSLGDLCSECGAYKDARPSDPTYRHHLFSLADAANDVRAAQGGVETSLAAAKLSGKLLANSAIIGGKFGFKLMKQIVEGHKSKK